ncbi:MAG: bifunctional diaminohydroxyphosphoribosylaminopyrimidine deaminase/5-amino-6-(5-phosphoribosylamino)uracil reductase RibD [Xanthobacteraceae bacterium]
MNAEAQDSPPQAATAPADPAADERFMALAFALGRRGLGNTWPNPAVGAVVVKNGVILGRGWTQPGGRPHAETEALKQAGRAARGATLYVTLEPCSHHGKTPPCTDAIIRAGIARVISAMDDPNPEVAGQGLAKLRDRKIEIESGLGAEAAQRAHIGHITRMTQGRPNVMLKLALSADGKIGAAGRQPVAITGSEARERVFQMRAMNDAILVGMGTVLSDDPALTCRLPGMMERSPVRILLDARLRVPISTGVVGTAHDAPTWIFGDTKASAMGEEVLRAKGVEVFRVESEDGRLDLSAVLKVLVERGITRLMVEGGSTVAASFVKADLVDEAALFRAPKQIGPHGIDALDKMPLTALTSRLKRVTTEQVGADTLELYERA